MIPTKRASPFVRTKSFQQSQGRHAQGSTGSEGQPFPKRSALARTMSTPFHVLSPSMKTIKNPFETLSLTPDQTSSTPIATTTHSSPPTSTEDDNPDDEALDPSRTLQMFSFSQTATDTVKDSVSDLQDSDDEELELEVEPETVQDNTKHQPVRKPRLHEALEMSLNPNKPRLADDLLAPATLDIATKRTGSEVKTSMTFPLDWSLKSSISITSRDSLSWCDQGTTLDDIEALQQFLAGCASTGNHESGAQQSRPLSPRTRLISASYHWCYPTNSPTVPQAQSVSKMLKNSGNMSAGEKTNITDLFSRSSEWKQAFTALYQSCRNGACPYFYYIGSAWSILFQHGAQSTSGQIEAILTNSTPGLRKVLDDEEITFQRVPTMGGKVTVHSLSSKHDLERLDDESDSQTKTPFQMPAKQELSDTLLFKGQVDVHGLFGYLLNLKTSYEDGYLYQSPTLIAGVPFLHAALKRSQLTKCKTISKHIEGTNQIQREFRVEMEGILLPTSVQALHRVFQDQQQPTGYTCISSSDARSHGLNLRPLALDSTGVRNTKDVFVSAKALDHLQYDQNQGLFSWIS
ncbi:hypothetical protein BGZ70_010566 [Mortierella alpina]|uniref:Uncharacterized protein n=1 Tax=Mortierella alpina TaxID=64518 RepID=A0A9P6JFV6_MORAP|nr:hypothetical protein BGZ70_010566 [Mortierella alpina]